jgi:hypothetical protein
MTVRRLDGTTIALEGLCPIEDAEALTRTLLDQPGAAVDWRGCDRVHAAVLQVLLVARPPLIGPPRGRFLADHIAPQFAAVSTT